MDAERIGWNGVFLSAYETAKGACQKKVQFNLPKPSGLEGVEGAIEVGDETVVSDTRTLKLG